MPLPLSITDLLHGKTVEWERLELKAGWNPLDTLNTLCAFANDFHNLGGGYILIGVAEENGCAVLPPVGLTPDSLDRIQKEVLNLGQTHMHPPYQPVVVPYEIEGRHLLVLWAPGGPTRPYRARTTMAKGDRDFAWFIRKGSTTVKAKGADETELLSLANTIPFDDRVNYSARVDDLSRPLMLAFLKEVGSELAGPAESMPVVEVARQMHLTGGPPEAEFPLNVGLFFFHPEPHKYFPGTQIDVVWFPDGAGGDHFVEKELRGPIHQIIRETLEYIGRNFLSTTVIKYPDRAEADRVSNFPLAAVEEAIVNAMYHRAYDERAPVEVRIGRDELTVISWPGPDRSVKLEALRAGRAHSRRYRNRRIGELLKELELTEGRCTGIPKIQRAMAKNGSPEAIFEFDEDHSYFSTILPVHPLARVQPSVVPAEAAPTEQDPTSRAKAQGRRVEQVTEQDAEQVTEQDAGQGSEQDTEQVTEQVGRLLIGIGPEPQAGTDLMALVGLIHRPTFYYDYLQPALSLGLVEMTLPDKPTSGRQRYRLTAAGAAWVARTGR